MIFGEIVIEPHQSRRVVVESLVGGERRRKWQTKALNEIEEPRHRVRTGAEALQRERISSEEREQRIRAPRECERAEGKELVLYERTTSAKTDLILRVLLTERGARVGDEFEIGIAQRVTHGALEVVGSATGSRRNLTASELSARDVIGTRDDASVAHGFR